MDKETQNAVRQNAEVEAVLATEGWQMIYRMAQDKILDLQSINNLDLTTTESAILDIKARRMASQVILDWLKEVHALALNNNSVRQSFQDDQTSDSYIVRS